ncbi:LuxR family transcriptional regulator [Glycomyces sp. NRRL B-16210]|uniref:LuxR family transcriptional regulator n=1 Tax=Glycomyces sp. NRRL B-16210 TaxID=1463821 RepID=UPI00068B099F|nr:LuxR family transcriptional regulator [Glycomyces sp. NRRL B-16210]
MGRSALEHPARAEAPARLGAPPLAATVRRLDDGSVALVVTAADAHLLHEANRSGATLTVNVTAGSAQDAARAALARGRRAIAAGPLGDAYASLLLAATIAADNSPALALNAITAAADAAWAAGDHAACTAALDAARRALEPVAPEARTPLHDYLLGLRALLGPDPAGAIGPMRRVLALADDGPDALHHASVAALLLGDVGAACRAGMRALAAARSQGRDDLVPRVLEYLAYAEMRAGRHARARAHAGEGLLAAIGAGCVNTVAHHRAVLALTASVEGDTAQVEAEAALALATARRHGLAQTGTLAEWALARADLGRGRPDAAASRLAGLVGAEGGHFALRPLVMPCFIEAAALAGRMEEARPVVRDLRVWAGFGLDRGAFAQLARCQALTAAHEGPAEAVEGLFRRAVELHPQGIGDFERARTLLLYGKWLRRRRQPGDARAVLREALHGFERCGAAGWAGQARDELRATGEQGGSRAESGGAETNGAGSALHALTPHQSRIARQVATGATNREVAQSFGLSVRTVDHHLRNIFAALGVRSRVELARLVADESKAPDPKRAGRNKADTGRE